MIAVKDGGPAFPASEGEAHQIAYAEMMASGAATSEEKDAVYMAAKAAALRGMSIRDHFAGLAMQAMFNGFAQMGLRTDPATVICAREAYAVADAMIRAREVKS